MIKIREKAEFFGACQWCGAFQKLPGGVLAKHGYTVQWGFFNGICGGAGYLPYEQSCDLVKKSIAEVSQRIKDTNRTIATVLKSTSDEVRANIRINVRGKFEYKWIMGKVEKEGDILVLKYKNIYNNQEETYKFNFYDFNYAKTVTDGVKAINKGFAEYLKQEVKQMETYIKFQQERVDKWVRKDLHPVDPSNPLARPDRPVSTRKTYIANPPDNNGRVEIAKSSKPINFAVWGKHLSNRGGKWVFMGWTETEKQALAKKKYWDNQIEQYRGSIVQDYEEIKILSVTGN